MCAPNVTFSRLRQRHLPVACERGTSKFSGIATSRKPKLYVVSVDEKPIYVGLTKQPIRNRLRLGWNAKRETGYYSYAWRHHHENVFLDVGGSRRPSDKERMP